MIERDVNKIFNEIMPIIMNMLKIELDRNSDLLKKYSDLNRDVVILALKDSFFLCLAMVGGERCKLEQADKQIALKICKGEKHEVQLACEPLDNKIDDMVRDGTEPLAIAHALVGAITAIAGSHPDINNQTVEEINYLSLMHISEPTRR